MFHSYTEADVLAEIRRRIKLSSQKQVAKEVGVSPQYMNDIVRGRRAMTDKLAASFGFIHISYYVKR